MIKQIIYRYLRTILCFSIVSFIFGFNALIYQDADIKARSNLEIDPDVI